MNKFIVTLAVALTAIATAQAGTYYEGSAYADRPGSESGRGFYIGLQGGLNLYQTTDDLSDHGLRMSSDSNVGGFGGLKIGYTADTVLDTIRPAVEFDGFYNGCSQDVTIKYRGLRANGKLDMDSGAFMVNGLVRFALGAFQPYVGVGAGVYTAKITTDLLGDSISDRPTDFAWQIVAGADYYVTSGISIFTEYKFLNYMDGSDRTGQQLLGGGIRFHF